MHLVNGMGNSPSPGRQTPGLIKQDNSLRGSVDTTTTRLGPQRVRMSSGERPIVAAEGKQLNIEALCQTAPHLKSEAEDRALRMTERRPSAVHCVCGHFAVGCLWFCVRAFRHRHRQSGGVTAP